MVSDDSKICNINRVSHALKKYELIRTEEQLITANKDHQVPAVNQKEFEEWEDNEVDITLAVPHRKYLPTKMKCLIITRMY